MCASVTFLLTTSRMRCVPASGANVRPLIRVSASSSSRSSLRPYARSDATDIDTPRLRSSPASCLTSGVMLEKSAVDRQVRPVSS